MTSRGTPSAPNWRTLTLRGKSAQIARTHNATMSPMRYFRLDMALPVGRKGFRAASKGISRFDLSQRGAGRAFVPAELSNERVRRLEALRITQPLDKFDPHTRVVPIAARIEEMHLER